MKLQNIILLLLVLFCLVLLLMKINIIETFEESTTTNSKINNDTYKISIIDKYNNSINSVLTDNEIVLTDSYTESILDSDYNKKYNELTGIKTNIINETDNADKIYTEYTIDNIGIIATNQKEYDNIKTIVNNKINEIENIYS